MSWAKAVDVIGLTLLKVLLSAWVLRSGFTHVSDDDYARVVISQLFAHSPKLDPSGTSWLPLPFWIVGGVMMAFGRSLATAQVVAFVCGVVSVVPVYLVARAAGVVRWCAVVGVVLAMATPWNAWLGVATVPEALTGALVATGAMAAGVPSVRGWAAAGLMAAALSRYEAWPVCAIFAGVCAVDAVKGARGEALAGGSSGRGRGGAWESWGRNAACAAIAMAGPLVWMAWNVHAHDGPLHFLRRVAAYRERVAPIAGFEAVIAFPRALVTGAPEVVGVAAVGAVALLVDGATRKRWAIPLLATAALVGFLMYGDWRGGAPTHHPERALVAAWWVLGVFGVDGVRTLVKRIAWGRPKREAWVAAATAGAVMSWAWGLERLQPAVGSGSEEARGEQLAMGRELAERGVGAIEVVPCRYEHFALLAAFGAPERAEVKEATGGAEGAVCPRVVVR